MKTITKYLCTAGLLLLLFPMHVFATATFDAGAFFSAEVVGFDGFVSQFYIQTSNDTNTDRWVIGDGLAFADANADTEPVPGLFETLELGDHIDLESDIEGHASPGPTSIFSSASAWGEVQFFNESDSGIFIDILLSYSLFADTMVDSTIDEGATASAGIYIDYGYEFVNGELPNGPTNGIDNGDSHGDIIERTVDSSSFDGGDLDEESNTFVFSLFLDPHTSGYAYIETHATGRAFSEPVANQVPEPATLFLLGTGLFGLIGGRKRFIKK